MNEEERRRCCMLGGCGCGSGSPEQRAALKSFLCEKLVKAGLLAPEGGTLDSEGLVEGWLHELPFDLPGHPKQEVAEEFPASPPINPPATEGDVISTQPLVTPTIHEDDGGAV